MWGKLVYLEGFMKINLMIHIEIQFAVTFEEEIYKLITKHEFN